MDDRSGVDEFRRTSGLLETRAYGRSLEVHARTGSTNDDARLAADRGAHRGHVVVADAQSAGRGSRGRVWSSPGGRDLYVSIVERVALPPRLLAMITLAVGLGVRDACAALLSRHLRRGGVEPPTVHVKWPNDVWIGARKVAGILVESSSLGETLGPVIVGIGVDVNRSEWPGELRDVGTSLAEQAGGPLDRAEALALVLREVERRVDALVAGGPEGPRELVAALRPHLALVGETVMVDDVVGTLVGLDEDGVVRIRTSDGDRRVLSGTLRAVPAL